MKQGLGMNVLKAARLRVGLAFGAFPRLYVSFSAGKDSTVLLHLAAEEARRRRRKLGVLLVDLEGQYRLTVEHALEMFERYADVIEPYWVALPLSLRNAVSDFEPKWRCWDPAERERWIRKPPKVAITEPPADWVWFEPGMEFEDFVPRFGDWYSQGELCGCMVGIRTDESLNRWRSLAHRSKQRFQRWQWSTWVTGSVYNLYPVYDWKTADIWTYHGQTRLPYNRLYDRMYQAGVPLHHQRICQPYGDDQRRGLWLFHLIEPDTWTRVVARVAGANSGALYAQDRGNILGNAKVSRPEGHTWQSFANLLLGSMPGPTAEHYRNKIALFIKWWMDRGYPQGIPDEEEQAEESKRRVPSWRRICRALLRHDWWCKSLSYSMTKASSYERYMKIMKKRRQKWGIWAN